MIYSDNGRNGAEREGSSVDAMTEVAARDGGLLITKWWKVVVGGEGVGRKWTRSRGWIDTVIALAKTLKPKWKCERSSGHNTTEMCSPDVLRCLTVEASTFHPLLG